MKDLLEKLRWAADQTFCEESSSIIEKAIDEIRFLRLEFKDAEVEDGGDIADLDEQRCGNCIFFQDERCKRNPPVFHDSYPLGVHPLVPADGWCGEWLPSDEDEEGDE